MEASEKAKILLEQMSSQTYKYQPYAGANSIEEEIGYEAGKKCALLCVENIIDMQNRVNIKFDFNINYWQEVEKILKTL